MAMVILGGLATSTALNLLVLPAPSIAIWQGLYWWQLDISHDTHWAIDGGEIGTVVKGGS
jgi:hypothetical protein